MMSITRREFLKLAGLTLGAAVLRPERVARALPDVPQGIRLGRITDGAIAVRSQPYAAAQQVRTAYEDEVVVWQREVSGPYLQHNLSNKNQRWVETPDGYIFSGYVQPVENRPNVPLTEMPAGQPGFWAEVTVPYVDLILANPPARSPWVKGTQELGKTPRLYYSQVAWIDQIRQGDNGVMLYRFNEDNYGSYGDIFWAEAAAFRPLDPAEIAPISPDVDPAEKKVVINLFYQTLSCFEGTREVFFCRVSTGAKWDAFGNAVDTWSTPIGEHLTSRKYISVHMAGGTLDGGWDTPAISWSTFFATGGIAIHAAFWHNQFGQERSHGCVNCRPEDAKWIFRWSIPSVNLEQGMVESLYPNPGSTVIVKEL